MCDVTYSTVNINQCAVWELAPVLAHVSPETFIKAVETFQKHIRGFLARKLYKIAQYSNDIEHARAYNQQTNALDKMSEELVDGSFTIEELKKWGKQKIIKWEMVHALLVKAEVIFKLNDEYCECATKVRNLRKRCTNAMKLQELRSCTDSDIECCFSDE